MHRFSYTSIFLAGVSAILLTAVTFDVLIDPYLVFGTPRVRGINAVKSEFLSHLRLGKAYVVRRVKPNAIVLGSSRSEHGIDPDHLGWGAATPRYNLALSGANVGEILAYLKHAHSIARLEKVVIGLDFFMFNVHYTNRPDFDESILSPEGVTGQVGLVLRMLQTAISSITVRSSIDTIRNQQLETNEVLDNGRRNSLGLQKFVHRNGGHRGAFLASEESFLREVYLPPPARRFDFEDGKGRSTLAQFRAICEFARREGIDLRLFISPSHARQWELIYVLGLWPKFEQWKRELLVIVDGTADANAGVIPFELWDFSGSNSVTVEEVPAPGDGVTGMHWYWESSHYTMEVGNMVLDRVFHYMSPGRVVPSDFGVLLASADIENQLSHMRIEQDEYRKRHPHDIAEIGALARRVLDAIPATQ